METEQEGEQLVLHWMEGQHLKLSWIYSPTTAQENVHSHNVRVLQMASGAQMCENQATCVESSDEDEDDMENDDQIIK